MEHQRQPRSYLKCSYCRDRKRKCNPHDRNWKDGQRCDNCIACKLPCGPNVLHTTPSTNGLPTTQSTRPSHIPQTSTPNPNSAQPVSVTETSTPFTNTKTSLQTDQEINTQTSHGSPSVNSKKLNYSPINVRQAYSTPCDVKIREKLSEIGSLLDLFVILQNRQAAVDKARSVHRAPHHDDVEKVIEYFSHCICVKLESMFDRILDLIDDDEINQDQEELFLWRLLHELESFTRHVPRIGTSGVCPQHQVLNKLQCQILGKLIPICLQHDEAKACYLSRSLALLRKTTGESQSDAHIPQSQETVALHSMSERISQTFKTIGKPPSFDMILPKTDNPFPATHIAILDQRDDIARILLQDGQHFKDALDILNRTVAHLLVETGNLQLLQKVITQEPELGTARDVFKLTALGIAAYIGKLDVVKALVNWDHSLHAIDSSGRSVLCIASGAGNVDIVQYLLEEKGLNPNDNGIGECTPLYAAAAAGHSKVVDLLLDHGALPNFRVNDKLPYVEALERGHLLVAGTLRVAMSQPRHSHQMVPSGSADHPGIPSSPFYDAGYMSAPNLTLPELNAATDLSVPTCHPADLSLSDRPSPPIRHQKRPHPPSRLPTPSPGTTIGVSDSRGRVTRQRT